MRTLDHDERETIRLAVEISQLGGFLGRELRAVLEHYELVPSEEQTKAAPVWQAGDRFRWEYNGNVATIERMETDTTATVRWEETGMTYRNFAMIGGRYPCVKLPPETEEEPANPLADWEAKAAQLIAESAGATMDDIRNLAAKLSAPQPTTPWHVGQRIRWKSDGDLGTITKVEENLAGHCYCYVEFDVWRDKPTKGMWVGTPEESMEPITDEPAPLVIGDRVRDSDGDCGIIKAIVDGDAWIRFDDFRPGHDDWICPLDELTRL